MGKVYYILNNGELKRKENTFYFKNGEVEKFIPIEDVDELFILSEISLNSKVIKILASKGICMHFFNHYGFYIGSFYPTEKHVSGFLLVKQVEHYLNINKRLELAKAFVMGALRNLSYVYNIPSESYEESLKEADSIEKVMNVEASFRKECYRRLEEETGYILERRTKNPPHNPLNALISFGNSLVYAKVLGEIYYTPLNPTVSYLHEPSQKRFSLSLDIAEIFKPLLSDSLIIKLLKEEVLTQRHFREELSMAYLNEEGKRIFLSVFNERLQQTIKHRKLNRKVSYRGLIRLELYKLIKHLLEEQVYVPFDIRKQS